MKLHLPPVGADLSANGLSMGFQADKSAVRQSIVRLRVMTGVAC